VTRRKRGPKELLNALELLGARRAPYADLLAAIVADTFARFPPAATGPVVELGAGTGQLRAWLPAGVRARVVHTDPSGRALRALRERAPDAQTRVARAERLPWPDGACAAVVGLDAFDAVAQALGGDPAPAVKEIARVLAPGGRFVHFLDMATLLEEPFRKLADAGLIPLPNVFSDPGDAGWPLDVLLVGRDWLGPVLDLAARAGHPLATELGPHFETFLARPFDADRAAASFRAIASSGERRTVLLAQLTSAARLSLQNGHPPIKLLPFHSGRYLLSLLQASFRADGVFEVEADTIVARSAWRARAADEGATLRYRSLCVGHQRLLDELPKRLLTPAGATTGDAPPDQVLVEAGVFVFVTRKV
jgi:SAM-dependent methyltransferase